MKFRYVIGFSVFFFISLIVSLFFFLLIPEARGYFLEEDSLVENLTVFLSAFAFLLGVVYALENYENRKLLLLLALFGLLGALEELSFGERIFSINMPVIGKYKIDCVHDVFYVAYMNIKNLSRSHGIIVYPFIIIMVISMVVYFVRNVSRIAIRIIESDRADSYILLIVSTVFVLVSLVIDLDIFDTDILFMLEEMLEMNSAVALIAACLSLDRRFARAKGVQS